MKQLKINLPDNISSDKYNIEVNNTDNNITVDIISKDFKFGDFVKVTTGIYNMVGIVENIVTAGCLIFINRNLSKLVSFKYIHKANDDEKIDIQHFLDDNNLVIDYEKKEIRKKRWRAEKQETFYYISEYGAVSSAVETLNTCDDYIYKYGNYFRTKEQAEKVAEEIKEVFERHKND